MRKDAINLETSRVWVQRQKGSLSVEQPIQGDVLRAIKRYLATRTDSLPWLFVSERGTQLTRQAVNYLIACISNDAGLPRVNPHMLRHSCGYYLADKATDLRIMQDYLGHRDPRHTVIYTRAAGISGQREKSAREDLESSRSTRDVFMAQGVEIGR